MDENSRAYAEMAIQKIKDTPRFERISFPFNPHGDHVIRNYIETKCGRGFIGSYSYGAPSTMDWYGTRWTFYLILTSVFCCKTNEKISNNLK